MRLEGGCYCGAVRFVTEGDPVMKAQCVCRECAHITGGGPNVFSTTASRSIFCRRAYSRCSSQLLSSGPPATPILRPLRSSMLRIGERAPVITAPSAEENGAYSNDPPSARSRAPRGRRGR